MKHYITIALCTFLSQMCTAQVMMLFSQDSLTGIVSPLDVDSLFYWFAADVGVTDSLGGAIATDEGVGTWNDLSGNGHHVTQSTNGARPVYKATGGPGSKPCIQFDGTNDFLASDNHFWGSDDISIFCVMKVANATRNAFEAIATKHQRDNDAQWQCYWNNDAAGTELDYVFYFTAFRTGLFNNNFVPFVTQGPTLQKSTSWKIYSFTKNGTTGNTLHADGSSILVTSFPSGTGDGTIYNSSSSALAIGARNIATTPDIFLQGSISELIIYSRQVSATERTAIENYLNRKYDLY